MSRPLNPVMERNQAMGGPHCSDPRICRLFDRRAGSDQRRWRAGRDPGPDADPGPPPGPTRLASPTGAPRPASARGHYDPGVRPVPLPDGPAPVETRSLVACVASILEVEAGDLAVTDDGDPWPRLTEALAGRGLAIVPVRDPGSFQWGGWWLARFAAGGPWSVLAGTPSAVVHAPGGTGVPGGSAPVEGLVVARPALELPRDHARVRGVVEAVFRAGESADPMERLAEAAVGASGVAGDRYAMGRGHFSPKGGSGRAVTLVEAESLERLAAAEGVVLAAGAHRRNVVTRGIDLNGTIGGRLRVGGVVLRVVRLAEPCAWLQGRTPPGTLRGLVHRGGVRADVLVPGVIRPGDPVEPVGS